jgi:pyridoxal 5'-phosphate synthase pdxS subunit
MRDDELMAVARDMRAPYELVVQVAREGKLPVANFAAGGIATPADAALMMELGADGVFVGSGIFKSDDPPTRARAIVEAAANYDNSAILLRISSGLGKPMKGRSAASLKDEEKFQARGR